MNPFKRKLSDSGASNYINKKRADSKGEEEVDTASELSKRLSKLEGHAESITNSYDGLPDLIVAFMSEKRELEDKLKSYQQKVVQLPEDIQKIVDIQHNAPDLDGVLESQFMDLREQVRSLTLNLCDPKISSSSIPSGLPDYVKKALAAISSVPTTQLLKSNLHARYFVQALIWRLLCDSILTNPFSIWGGGNEIGEFVRKVQDSPKLPIERRQFWRKLTGQILFDLSNPRRSSIENWRKKLVDYIRPLVKAEREDDVAKHVEPIIDKAIKLAKDLARSRTMCFIQTKTVNSDDSIPQKYDGRWMEVVEKAVVSYEHIDFLITPALVQVTNSVGHAFSNPRVIVKAEVCFGRGRLSISAPASDASPNKDRATETQSGRQSRGVHRLGPVANDTELEKIMGDDIDEARDSGSDYQEEEPGDGSN
ncbi:hypothetical protein F5B21DRAFT_500960 [Xylaria acuta]|nr:hypothetical protein F5B21DRAFT_500960 [Xylaria acuta]